MPHMSQVYYSWCGLQAIFSGENDWRKANATDTGAHTRCTFPKRGGRVPSTYPKTQFRSRYSSSFQCEGQFQVLEDRLGHVVWDGTAEHCRGSLEGCLRAKISEYSKYGRVIEKPTYVFDLKL